jgi:NTE family protein
MGDYASGYVASPRLPLADAMAASAAVPGLIGPLVLDTKRYEWSQFAPGATTLSPANAPSFRRIHLWDGGVYDNLGVEALFKAEGGGVYRDEYNFLLVSDGSSPLRPKSASPFGGALRLIDVATSQIRALRSRSLVDHFRTQQNSGAYLRLGNTAEVIARAAGRPSPAEKTLSAGTVDQLSRMGTHLRAMPTTEITTLCRHGWEVADYTLSSYSPDYFEHVPWPFT